MATPLTPGRKRLAMLVVAVGSALIVERVVALSAGEGVEAAEARPGRVAEMQDGVAPGEAGDASPAANEPAASAAAGELRLDRLARRLQVPAAASAASRVGLFDVVSWQPPVPKVVAAPPPRPVAPPFPYLYMGRLSEDGVRTAFFMKGSRVLPVKAGDVVDAAYRVDEMTEQQMTLTYLPLNETLSVALEGAR
jgi:hypothetical protein